MVGEGESSTFSIRSVYVQLKVHSLTQPLCHVVTKFCVFFLSFVVTRVIYIINVPIVRLKLNVSVIKKKRNSKYEVEYEGIQTLVASYSISIIPISFLLLTESNGQKCWLSVITQKSKSQELLEYKKISNYLRH